MYCIEVVIYVRSSGVNYPLRGQFPSKENGSRSNQWKEPTESLP